MNRKLTKQKIKNLRFYTVTRFGQPCDYTEMNNDLQDMLRYDLAFICEKYPTVLAIPTLYNKHLGSNKGSPTTLRWRSFGCVLINISDHDIIQELSDDIKSFNGQHEWFTYHHPDLIDGGMDFEKLIRRNLSEFLLGNVF